MKNKIAFFTFSLILLAVLIFHASPAVSQNLLPPPSDKSLIVGNANQENPETPEKKGFSEFQKLLATIGVVTGFLLLLFLLLRKMRPDYPKPLPREIFEMLGKSSIGFNQQVVLLRCGRKIFVTAISSLGVERIGEITDPAEVEHLVRMCRGQSEISFGGGFEKNEPVMERGAIRGPAGTPKTSFDEIYQQVLSGHGNSR